MVTISLKLGEQQIQRLDKISSISGIFRSELIRRSIDIFLDHEVEKELRTKQLQNGVLKSR